MDKITVKALENAPLINNKAKVTFKQCGNILETIYLSHRNTKCFIKKIDENRYIDLRTGEVKEFTRNESRKDDLNGVRSSLRRLRDYINCNTTRPLNCRWTCFTYHENMTDTKRLYVDVEIFIKKLHYYYGDFEYIVAMEPQGRGAWHGHLLLIFTDTAPYIPNSEFSKLWGFGFTKVKKLDNVDNVGAYLTAYLGDIEYTKENAQMVQEKGGDIHLKTIEEKTNGKKLSKRYIKGGRLYLYPVGFHMYRASKGINKPVTEVKTEKETRVAVKDLELTYEKAIEVSYEKDTANGVKTFSVVVYYRNYNILRKKPPEPPPKVLPFCIENNLVKMNFDNYYNKNYPLQMADMFVTSVNEKLLLVDMSDTADIF